MTFPAAPSRHPPVIGSLDVLVDQSNATDQMQNKCKHMINVGRRRISAPRDEMRSCMTPNTADQLQTVMLIASWAAGSTANWSLKEKEVGLRSGGMIPLGLHNGPRVQAIGIFNLILELRCCCAAAVLGTYANAEMQTLTLESKQGSRSQSTFTLHFQPILHHSFL